MEKKQISEMMEITMQKVKEMVDANTIVGEPIITADGITLIPVSKLTFGFGGGGSDFSTKDESKDVFAGGIGAGVNIIPVAFIVVKSDSVKLLHISPPSESTINKVLDTVPEVFDKVSELVDKYKTKDEDEDETD